MASNPISTQIACSAVTGWGSGGGAKVRYIAPAPPPSAKRLALKPLAILQFQSARVDRAGLEMAFSLPALYRIWLRPFTAPRAVTNAAHAAGSERRCGCAMSGTDVAQSQKHDAVATREWLGLGRKHSPPL
eukprot:4882601-Pleurochrysis_carterae.AAC.3